MEVRTKPVFSHNSAPFSTILEGYLSTWGGYQNYAQFQYCMELALVITKKREGTFFLFSMLGINSRALCVQHKDSTTEPFS